MYFYVEENKCFKCFWLSWDRIDRINNLFSVFDWLYEHLICKAALIQTRRLNTSMTAICLAVLLNCEMHVLSRMHLPTILHTLLKAQDHLKQPSYTCANMNWPVSLRLTVQCLFNLPFHMLIYVVTTISCHWFNIRTHRAEVLYLLFALCSKQTEKGTSRKQ